MNFLTDFLGLHPNIYCSDSPIGLETGTVPDRNITASSYLDYKLLTDFLGLHPNIYCSDSPIGLETGTVPDRNITASSYLDSNPPSAARLGSHVGWCPLNLSKVFLQVDLGSAYYICAVATQGHFEQGFGRLARYAILLSLNGKNWTEYEQVMTSNS